ncbi:DNA-binding NarL/FixJ family response regulator [Catenulispora sp. GAS73]|uniref:ATP-binding protein n=1 Tax=Catenulispora sp. GAS73 TaxID=3156269 RepID=UPI003513AA86
METESAGVRLVERESELAELVRYAGQAAGPVGRLVLLSGEAGVGKSALVEAARRQLTTVRWSWSACDGLFIPRPLGPLFDVAGQLGGELGERCEAGADREELFRALLNELGSADVPDVVVVEDLHWADEATLDLLRFLSRRLRDAPVTVIVTYRDDETGGDALRVALGDLVAQPSTRRIRLEPLSEQAVRVLADGSGFAPDDVFRLTAGNPFYVTELLQAETHGVPASARDVVLARIARLTAGARAVLEVAALIGTKVELPLLAALSDAAGLDRLDRLDDLLASGLLVADGIWLRFRHEIARLAIAEAVPAHRRLLIHRRVLDALHTQNCDDEARLAYHAEAAGDAKAVLRYAPAAARRAARLGAHHEAAAQFNRALRFADHAGPTERAGLYEEYADELTLLDRLTEAEDAGNRALSLRREVGDRLGEGAALARLSRIAWSLCRGQDAVTGAYTALAVLEPLGPTVELAGACATLAHQRLLYADYNTAIALARRARQLAERFGATAVLSGALNTEGAAAAGLGQEWTGLMHQALKTALVGRHQDQAARAYANLVGISEGRLRFADAERYLLEGLVYCDEHDATAYSSFLRGEQAHVFERTGRWDEAVAVAERVLNEVGPSAVNRQCALVRIGVIRARRGESGFWHGLDEAAATADEQGEPPYQVAARLARTEAHWLAGETAQARREAESAGALGEACTSAERGAVAVWLRRTGSRHPIRGDIAEPYRQSLAGDAAGAAALWTDLGCPYEAGLALLDSGQEAHSHQAYRIFNDLGATAAAQVARRALRSLGARSIPTGPRAATQAHPLGLTRRQHDVLGLIADGHTNAQIAERLFISAKTVDHHVSAILAKLQAPDRATAGRIARSGFISRAAESL